MTASEVAGGLVVFGVSLAALAVKAAWAPTTIRLFLTAATLIGILLAYQAL